MSEKAFPHKTAENAKPGEKPYKLSTGRGFYLLIMPAGGKLWRYDYRLDGKRKTAALGSFPDVSLKAAADKVAEYRKLIRAGVDPVAEKKRVKACEVQQAAEQARTFEVVAREWFDKRTTGKADRYRKQIRDRLENQLFPLLGTKPMSSLEAQDFLDALRPVEERGALDMAHRLAQLINQIGKYAKVAGYTKHNEAADIREALKSRGERKHHAAITKPGEVGMLLRAIDEYPGNLSIRYALKILPYVFVRSGELRGARWEEIDRGKGEWVIPSCRMKMKRPHVVLIARQVMKLFEELWQWTGDGALVFPSPFSATTRAGKAGRFPCGRKERWSASPKLNGTPCANVSGKRSRPHRRGAKNAAERPLGRRNGFSSLSLMPEKTRKYRSLNIEELIKREYPPRDMILSPVLAVQSLSMIFAMRGVGKTFFALSCAYAVASGGVFGRWFAPLPARVLYIDGEMPAVTLQERLMRIAMSADKDIIDPNMLRILNENHHRHAGASAVRLPA